MNIFLTYINENQRTSLLSSLRAFLHSFIRRWTLDVGCWAFALSVRPKPTAYSLRSAFTLIEVLVAMAVLSILIVLAANIFQGSSSAFNIGTQKADMNTCARAALDFMARELESAVAGRLEAASLSTPADISFVLIGGSELQFVSLSGDPDPPSDRALRAILVRYDSGNKIIETWRETTSFNPYTDSPAWTGASMLITNVLALTMAAFSIEADLAGGGTTATNAPRLPLCLDITIEMLSDDDMRKYIATGNDPDFRNRNAKFYTTRVYFPNRMGYR